MNFKIKNIITLVLCLSFLLAAGKSLAGLVDFDFYKKVAENNYSNNSQNGLPGHNSQSDQTLPEELSTDDDLKKEVSEDLEKAKFITDDGKVFIIAYRPDFKPANNDDFTTNFSSQVLVPPPNL
jgi:hypothetical protein